MRLKLFWLVVMMPLLAGCFPAQAGLSTTTVRAELVRLPPTWTNEPTTSPGPSLPTATILPSDVGSTPTQFQIIPSEKPRSPTSAPEVPFSGIKAFDAQQLWVYGSDQIWRSEDGGLSWQNVSPDQGGSLGFWRSSIVDEMTAYAGFCTASYDKCGLIRTLDGGITWEEFYNINYDPFGSLTTFFDQDHGVYQGGLGDAAAGSSYIHFYETVDGGRNWDRITIETPTEFMSLTEDGQIRICNCGDSLIVDPRRVIHIPGNMVRDPWEEFKVWISWDRGQNWSISNVLLPSGKYNPGMIDPLDPVFFNEEDGILPVRINVDFVFDDIAMLFYSTEDGGLSWTYQSLVEDVGIMYMDYRMLVVSEQDIYFVCGNDLCASHDSARTWQRITTMLNWNSRIYADAVWSFDFGDRNNGWALANNPDESRSLWKTEDGGWTWTVMNPVFTP